ncbi:MAG: aspartate/glutamate racemase family protein [Chitinophagaceae bacterium]
MKTIGIIGGLSWLSTEAYYRLVNEMINEKLGGVSSAKVIVYSVNFEEIKTLTFAGDWQGISKIICSMAQKVEHAGADCLLIGANTMHKIAGEIQQAISIPLIHIAAETGKAIEKKGLSKIALLGTKYTMELGFYQQQLEKHSISTIIPNETDRHFIHDAIYNEMGKNIFLPATKQRFLSIIDSLVQEGAAGIILGCTEIPLLLNQQDCSVPVFDTTQIHAAAAVAYALE